MQFFLRRKVGVAQRIRNSHSGNDSVGSYAEGNGHDGTHMHHGHIGGVFNSLGERCTATRTRSSRRCKDNGLHLLITQSLTDFCAKLFGIGHSRAIAHC